MPCLTSPGWRLEFRDQGLLKTRRRMSQFSLCTFPGIAHLCLPGMQGNLLGHFLGILFENR